jgi:exopolysaccharide production protein ExoY
VHAISELAITSKRYGPVAEVPAAARVIYCFEPLVGALLSVAAAPALLVSAGLVFALSRKSPFIAHLRIGQGGAPFWMWKLRTMWDDAEPLANRWTVVERIARTDVPDSKSGPDPRVRNWFASFCRKYSIDELPQFLHVAAGRMSLVGPRPITAEELDRYYGNDSTEILRLRAGLTGLWQVNGRNRLSYTRRRELDLLLVNQFSLQLYFTILLKTVPKVLSGADAN